MSDREWLAIMLVLAIAGVGLGITVAHLLGADMGRAPSIEILWEAS